MRTYYRLFRYVIIVYVAIHVRYIYMPDTMTGELYAVVYVMCVKTCHLFAYDGLDCFALPCDVMYKIWSINLYI